MSEPHAGEGAPLPRQARLTRYQDARKRLSPRTSLSAFEELVAEALDELPAYARERMENVAVVVEERPRPERVVSLGFQPGRDLLGLYEGVNRVQRAAGYNMAIPDKITLYRQPILNQVGSANREAVKREIRGTVIHEVAHHFGYDDAELARLEGR